MRIRAWLCVSFTATFAVMLLGITACPNAARPTRQIDRVYSVWLTQCKPQQDASKDGWARRYQLLSTEIGAINQDQRREIIRDLVARRDKSTKEEDAGLWTQFVDELEDVIIMELIVRHDRPALVDLIASAPIATVYGLPVECALATMWDKSDPTTGVEVLVDAAAIAKPEKAVFLIEMLRRARGEVGIPPSMDQFVAEYRKWLEEQRGRTAINPRYPIEAGQEHAELLMPR